MGVDLAAISPMPLTYARIDHPRKELAMIRHSGMVLLVGSALALFSTGCVTRTAGLTPPSSQYLQTQAKYLPAEPTSPAQKESVIEKSDAPMPLPPAPPEKKSLGKRVVEFFTGLKKQGKCESAFDPNEVSPQTAPHPTVDRYAPATRESVLNPFEVQQSNGKQLSKNLEKLEGTFIRETDAGTISLTFEDKLLKICVTMKVKGHEKPISIRAEADYSVNSQGKVFGAISNVDYPGEEVFQAAGIPMQIVSDREGEPFAFRTRFDSGVLTVSDLKIHLWDSNLPEKRPAFNPFLGKYKRPEAPKPTTVVPATFSQPASSKPEPQAPNKIPLTQDAEELPKPREVR